MKETASPTVLRFWTSLSGILTPNFSSAATTTSTMDSESTSRSSVNDFSSATSSGFTPATSSRISARPLVISSRLLICSRSPFRWVCGWSVVVRSLRTADDLSGVGEAAAEGEEQDRGAGRHLAALHELGQGQGDTRRRRVAGLDDVLGDDGVGDVEPLHDAVDDARVGLVGDERREVARVDAGPFAGLERQRGECRRGPAEDRLPFL